MNTKMNTVSQVAMSKESVFVSIIITSLIAFQILVYKSGFPGASGDDFFRVLMTYEWKESPFLVSSSFGLISVLWFPTHFWITGLIYSLTNNLVISLTGVSILFSLVGLFILFHLAKTLFNRQTGYITILLAGFLPWQVWLGISMTEMTMYFSSILGAFLFFIKWHNENKPFHLLISSIFFLLATMFRPEGWIFAGLFSIYLMVFLIRNRAQLTKHGYVIASTIIPCLFILSWLAYNFKAFGNPVYFLQINKLAVQNQLDLHGMTFYINGLKPFFLMFIVSPVLFLLTILSLVICFRSLKKNQRNYLIFILAQLAVMVAASIYGAGTTAAPQRYVLINIILLVPFVAYILNLLWNKRYGYIAVVFILCIYLGINGFKSFCYPAYYKDTIKVGKYLKDNFESRLISPSEQISSELAFRRITGQFLTTKKDFLMLTSEHAALEAYSERPRNFLFNILQLEEKEILKKNQAVGEHNNNKMISADSSEISAKLKEMQVTRIILENRELMNLVPPHFYLEKMIGNYAIFSNHFIARSIPNSKLDAGKKFNPIRKFMDKGINLKGYKYRGGFFPNSLHILWELDNEYSSSDKYRIRMAFSYLLNPDKKFERIVTPIFHWYKIDAAADSLLVEDNIPLFLPDNMPNGDYSLKLSLIKQESDDFNLTEKMRELPKKEITLLPITLISSKREALADFLGSRNHDWKLLTKILMVL